jgi:hypothetical protein
MALHEYEDFLQMVQDVRAHVRETGKPVLGDDDPVKLSIGYFAEGRDFDVRWKIRLTNIKKSLQPIRLGPATTPENSELLHNVGSASGRLRIVNSVLDPK